MPIDERPELGLTSATDEIPAGEPTDDPGVPESDDGSTPVTPLSTAVATELTDDLDIGGTDEPRAASPGAAPPPPTPAPPDVPDEAPNAMPAPTAASPPAPAAVKGNAAARAEMGTVGAAMTGAGITSGVGVASPPIVPGMNGNGSGK
jgi:hypothetical protein